MIRSAVRTTLRSILRLNLVAERNQTVIEVQRTDSMMAELLWQVELTQLAKEVHPLLGLFNNGVNVSVPLTDM